MILQIFEECKLLLAIITSLTNSPLNICFIGIYSNKWYFNLTFYNNLFAAKQKNYRLEFE